MENKKRVAEFDGEVERSNKKQKVGPAPAREPSLTDLPDDPLLHVLDFVGARSLLTLASSCSRLKSIVDSRLQACVKKIFPVGFDHLLESANRAESVLEIKRAAQIEEVFGYRVKIMALEPGTDEQQGAEHRRLFAGGVRLSSPLQLLTWDDHKLASISPNHRRCTIICSETGRNICVINFDFNVIRFASSSLGQLVFSGTTTEGGDNILVYAFDDQYTPSQIGSFTRNNPNGQLIDVAWTASNDLILIRSTSYELCTISGESLRTKVFEVDEEGAVHMAVSPDGALAIRAQYDFAGEPATFYRVDLATGTEKRVFTIESVADFMDHLRFVGNNPDLLTWYIEGTGQSATFLYNFKTNKKKMWAVNTGVNDLSLDGTKVVTQIYDGEHAGRSRILDIRTNKQLGAILTQEAVPEAGKFLSMSYYNWTYPASNGPSEKLLTSGSDRVSVFDPQTGKHLAELKHFDEDVFVRLVALSRDNRTLVFGGDMLMGRTDASNAIVWHFY
jgi:WD40 repeat protein